MKFDKLLCVQSYDISVMSFFSSWIILELGREFALEIESREHKDVIRLKTVPKLLRHAEPFGKLVVIAWEKNF